MRPSCFRYAERGSRPARSGPGWRRRFEFNCGRDAARRDQRATPAGTRVRKSDAPDRPTGRELPAARSTAAGHTPLAARNCISASARSRMPAHNLPRSPVLPDLRSMLPARASRIPPAPLSKAGLSCSSLPFTSYFQASRTPIAKTPCGTRGIRPKRPASHEPGPPQRKSYAPGFGFPVESSAGKNRSRPLCTCL